MESITRHDLEKRIIQNQYGSIDFYAYCNTPWHSLGIQTFVNELSKRQTRVTGIVFLSNAPGKKSIVSPDDFIFNDNVEVIYLKNIDANRNGKLKYLLQLLFSPRRKIEIYEKPLYILRAFSIDYKFGAEIQLKTGRKCVLVGIDEGIGAYKSKKEILREKFSDSSKLKSALNYIIDSILDGLLLKKYKLEVIKYFLFKYESHKLVLNKELENLYRETISKLALKAHNKKGAEISGKYVILLTEPYDLEYQKLAKRAINNMYLQLKTEFEKKNIKVLIKPHPREEIESINAYRKEGFSITSGEKPLETHIETLPIKPLAIFGTLGTALVTVNAINGLPSYSIVDLVKHTNLNRGYLEAVEKYKKRYSDFVYFPKSLEDCINEIEKNGI